MTNPPTGGSHKSVADGVTVKPEDESFGKNAEQALEKTPFVGSGYKTVRDAADRFGKAENFGDVAAASGQLALDGAGFVAGCATDLAGFVMDPVGWLVSNGLNMLLELIQPLQDALHFVTGDGPSLSNASDNFGKIGEGFVTLADDFVTTGESALQGWTEDAGNAAREALGDFSVGIKGVGSSAGAVAETLKMWSMVMQVIEEVIKSIISEFVSFLIYIWLPALAASIISFGSSVAGAMATSVAKAASVMSKVTSKLGKLGKLLDKFMEFLVKYSDKLAKAAEKMKVEKGGLAVGGALAKGIDKTMGGFETRLGATGDAALDVLKGTGKTVMEKTAKEFIGTNPADAAKSPFHAAKAGVDATKKAIQHGQTAAKGDIGGRQDAEETRENLDI